MGSWENWLKPVRAKNCFFSPLHLFTKSLPPAISLPSETTTADNGLVSAGCRDEDLLGWFRGKSHCTEAVRIVGPAPAVRTGDLA